MLFPRTTIVLAIVVFSTQFAKPQSTLPPAELQAVLRVLPNGAHIPTFEIELANTGQRDLILDLGYMYRGRQFTAAIRLSLKDDQNQIKILDLKGPPIVAGRVDALVVPLPKGARIILPVNLADYSDYANPDPKAYDVQLTPGRYLLSAEYRGVGVEHANLDMQGIRLLPYWLGKVDSNKTSFVVSEK